MKNIVKSSVSKQKKQKLEIENFFEAITGTPASQAKYDIIRSRKQQFLDWLKTYDLLYLTQDFDTNIPISAFEWQCRQDILTILVKFDLFMLQCIYNESIEFQDRRLKERMTEFSEEYENVPM